MKLEDTRSQFNARLRWPKEPGKDGSWAFVVLPKEASAKLPRRGRVTVDGRVNGHEFQALLEPDGQKSHWLRIDEALMERAGVSFGDIADFEVMYAGQEPEPQVPSDLQEALDASPEAKTIWHETTTVARLDWIHWIDSAKQQKTRIKRINDACEMLASGKKRVCCFDPSGFYSKALRAPEAAD